MSYLQTWIVDRIADRMSIAHIARSSQRALRSKRTAIGKYIIMRTAYGAQHHWPLDETGTDIDVYDHDPNTHYFLAYDKKVLVGGLRLTKSKEFDETLSLSMWSHAIDKPRVVAQLVEHKDDVMMLKKAARAGKLWDLTRLVTAMSLLDHRTPKLKRATYVALLLLLGVALKYTGKDSVWLFTTNREVRRFLERLGVSYAELASGRISYSDAGDSYFGWVSAYDAYQQLLKSDQPVIVRMAERGYAQKLKVQSGSDIV